MNTQVATTKAIDWKHVAGVTLRAAWWLLKMAFKTLVILCTAIFTVVGIIFLSGSDDAEDERAKDITDREERSRRGIDDYERYI